MRILCCADLHLGRSSSWITGPAEVDRSATGAWKRIVQAALSEPADAVVIAGDVFDGPGSYYEVRSEFRRGCEQLKAAQIPVLAVSGNHDWAVLRNFAKTFPDCGLTLLGTSGWETLSLGAIDFIGWSFNADKVKKQCLPTTIRGDRPTVGLVHGDCHMSDSPYHPLRADELLSHADAWIVGHIHNFHHVRPQICYPGSPQALDFGPGERGKHGFVWLTLQQGRLQYSDLQPCSSVWFEERDLTIDAEGESAELALERSVSTLADDLCREHRDLQSVQFRLNVRFLNTELPRELRIPSDTRHGYQVVRATLQLPIDPQQWAQGADVRAEISRLYLGTILSPNVPQEWVESANAIVNATARDLRALWQSTYSGSVDLHNEAAPLPPSEEQLLQTARIAVQNDLETRLHNLVQNGGQE